MSALATFTGGLIMLLVAGHAVVRAASALGARLGLQPLTVGLTIVAAGTSAPELAVVGGAVAAEDTELAVGSIIGSNIANVLLVLGLVACLGTIHVTSRVVRTDIPVMIGASALFLFAALDGSISRGDGVLFLAVLALFIRWTIGAARPEDESGNRSAPGNQRRERRSTRTPIWRIACELALGITGLTIAARFVVRGAESIAAALGVPELVIGLTIVALGTSAPEIATALIAAARGRRDLAVGSAIGSNIFNILLVLGAIGAVAPDGIALSDDALRLDLPILLASAVACLPIIAWDHKLDRWEGAMFVAYYVAYLAFLVLDSTGHGARDPFALVMVAFVLPLTVVTAATVIDRQRRRAERDGNLCNRGCLNTPFQ